MNINEIEKIIPKEKILQNVQMKKYTSFKIGGEAEVLIKISTLEELTKIISDPEVIANQTEWQKAMKEHASMEEIVLKFREYKKIKQSMEEAEELMQDPDMKELAEEEYYASKEKLPKLEEELKVLLIPKDPDDDKNIICEIRAGAGGEEAALFAGTLFRMYTMYAEKKHWKLEILNENETKFV